MKYKYDLFLPNSSGHLYFDSRLNITIGIKGFAKLLYVRIYFFLVQTPRSVIITKKCTEKFLGLFFFHCCKISTTNGLVNYNY